MGEMRHRMTGAGLVLLLPLAPAAASPANDAKSACRDQIRRDYNAGTRNVTASERGYERFNVGGVAERLRFLHDNLLIHVGMLTGWTMAGQYRDVPKFCAEAVRAKAEMAPDKHLFTTDDTASR